MTIRAVLLVGHSNAGKSPLGACIESRSDGAAGRPVHLDFGDLLRRTVAGRFDPGLGEEERAFLASVMNGRLLDDEHFSIARKVVLRFLDERGFDASRDLLVLNGMPRHAGQARDVAAMGIDVRLVIHLQCDAPTALARKRRADAGVGHEDRSGRGDADLETFRRRIESFDRETAPMLSYYRARGTAMEIVDVTEDMTPAEMVAACAAALGGIH